jgi:hypothetical protein
MYGDRVCVASLRVFKSMTKFSRYHWDQAPHICRSMYGNVIQDIMLSDRLREYIHSLALRVVRASGIKRCGSATARARDIFINK